MKPTVTYSVVARQHPGNPDKDPLFYAVTQARGVVNVTTLAKSINAVCTVTKADIYAVLGALEDMMVSHLKNGEIVRLGGFGSLQVCFSSSGARTKKEFSPMLIHNVHYVFRPGETLMEALATLNFKQVPIRYKKKKPKSKSSIKARSDIIN